MTAERRLAKLEGALSPKAATLLWLTEAHGFGSLEAYVDWLIDQPVSAAPLERVPEQARTAVVQGMRGQPRAAVQEATHQAIRDAIFLVELVIRLNGAAVETSRTEGLRYAVLFWQMRALGAEASLSGAEVSRQAKSAAVARWRTWRADVTVLVTRLQAAEAARAHLERQYLDGHPTLFPDVIEDGERLREGAERLAGLGDSLSPLIEGHLPARRRSKVDLEAVRSGARAQAPALAARLVDEARFATLDVLGDGRPPVRSPLGGPGRAPKLRLEVVPDGRAALRTDVLIRLPATPIMSYAVTPLGDDGASS